MPLLSAAWLIAAVLDIQEGRQLMLVAMFQVVLLVALGPRLVWSLLAPLLFLFFLVPSGAFLVPSLQKITAHISVAGLQLLHIPVFSDGFMIEIPEGTFEIAEACAGLRFLIASIVFGCFFAVVMYRSYFKRIVFIALSVAVPIAANGMRALGIIVLAHLEGSAAAVEADHVLYGWLFFTLVIMLLIAIGMTFAEKPGSPHPVNGSNTQAPALAVRSCGSRCCSACPGWSGLRLPVKQPIPGWLPASRRKPACRPIMAFAFRCTSELAPRGARGYHEFLEIRTAGIRIVVRYIALYQLRAIGSMLTTSENRLADDTDWHIAERGEAALSLGGEKITVASAEIVSGARRRLVWSFYIVDGRITARLFEAKLLQARAVLLRRAPVAALVAVSARWMTLEIPQRSSSPVFWRRAAPCQHT